MKGMRINVEHFKSLEQDRYETSIQDIIDQELQFRWMRIDPNLLLVLKQV